MPISVRLFAGNNYTQLLGDHKIASLIDLFAGPDRLGQPSASSAMDVLESELAKSKSESNQKAARSPTSPGKGIARPIDNEVSVKEDPSRRGDSKGAWRDAERSAEQIGTDGLDETKSFTPGIIKAEAERQRAQEAAKYGQSRFSDKAKKLSATQDEDKHRAS